MSEDSVIRFQLPARTARPSGKLPKVAGQLKLDVHDLTRIYGTVEVDLASIHFDGDDEGVQSVIARNWLELGEAVDGNDRERWRHASLTIRRGEDPSSPSAWSGQAGKASPQSTPRIRGVGADAETRTVRLDLVGDLLLHAVRVPQRVEVELCFHYDRSPTVSSLPTAVEVRSLGRFELALEDHDVRPRDSSGRPISGDLPLLGHTVGRKARIDVHLVAHLLK